MITRQLSGRVTIAHNSQRFSDAKTRGGLSAIGWKKAAAAACQLIARHAISASENAMDNSLKMSMQHGPTTSSYHIRLVRMNQADSRKQV